MWKAFMGLALGVFIGVLVGFSGIKVPAQANVLNALQEAQQDTLKGVSNAKYIKYVGERNVNYGTNMMIYEDTKHHEVVYVVEGPDGQVAVSAAAY